MRRAQNGVQLFVFVKGWVADFSGGVLSAPILADFPRRGNRVPARGAREHRAAVTDPHTGKGESSRKGRRANSRARFRTNANARTSPGARCAIRGRTNKSQMPNARQVERTTIPCRKESGRTRRKHPGAQGKESTKSNIRTKRTRPAPAARKTSPSFSWARLRGRYTSSKTCPFTGTSTRRMPMPSRFVLWAAQNSGSPWTQNARRTVGPSALA